MIERKDNIIFGDSFEELEIEIPNGKEYHQSNMKIRVCPECKRVGKKHFNDSSLSANPAKGVASCHKCGTRFVVREKKQLEETKTFTTPSKKNLTKLSAAGLKMLTDRKISQEAVVRHKIVERADDMIGFPYMLDGELVNIKYRGITEKKFSQSGGGMHVMYNHDNVKEYMESSGDFKVLICEGEICSLSWETSGVHFSLSVDSGAPNPKDNVDKKLECFTNSFDLIDSADVVYIAVDNDDNGKRLESELIRRLSFEKVKIISYAPHKDANDYLKWEGADKLRGLLSTAKDLKMEGIFTVEDVGDDLMSLYTVGLPKGSTTHFPSIDNYFTWRGGEVTILTGYNNEGKSALLHNMCIVKAAISNWPCAFFSPENFPAQEFFEDCIHTYIGKSSDIDFGLRMTKEEFKKGMDFFKNKFFLIHPQKEKTLDALFERFDFLVRKQGVRIAVLDPYNQIEHLMDKGETLDLYNSRFMSKLKTFAVSRNLCVVLVMHQNPPKTKLANGNYPEPDLYTIKSGGTPSDKCDNVIAYYRPFRRTDETNPISEFITQKIKKKKLTGKIGKCEIAFQWQSNRFLDEKLQGKSPLDVPLSFVEDIQYESQASSTGNLFDLE